MTELLLVVVPLTLLICYGKPRLGIFITLAVGFLADPVRKLLPGEPVALAALVAVYVVVTFAGAIKTGLISPPHALLARTGKFLTPISLFLFLVVVQSGIAFLRTGNPVIAGIGLLAYLAPAPAILLGYSAVPSERTIVRIVHFYAAFAALLASGIFLSASGLDNRLLWSVGEELVVYSTSTGEALRLICGFFRASEIAAWHCATAASLLVVLAVAYRRRRAEMWLAVASTLYFLMAIVFTGRRKAFAALIVFGLIFGFLLVRFRRGTATLAVVVVVVGFWAALFGEATLFSENFASRYQLYFEREQTTTPTTALERLRLMTFDSFKWVVEQNGYLGTGAGTGSQGAQHFGGGADVVGGAAEGGLGKILAELGVPGVALLLWIAFLMVRRLLREFRRMPRDDSVRATLGLGFLALLGTNAIEFVSAHQAYGDPFVLLMLGWILGFLLAIVRPKRVSVNARERIETALPLAVQSHVRPIEGIPGL